MIKKIKKIWKKLTLFDYLTVLLISALIIFLGLFFFRRQRVVNVWMKVSPQDLWYDKKPPYWLADNLHVGDCELDSLGRKAAQILEMKTYDRLKTEKDIYLKLRLRVVEDRQKHTYSFRSKPLEIGSPVELHFPSVYLGGMVTNIEGLSDNFVWEDKVIEARLIEDKVNFPGTAGVDPWIAEALRVGNQMKDNQGTVVAEVLDKRVVPASHTVITADGRVYIREDPLKKDVILTLNLRTVKQSGDNYFLYDQKIRVGSGIFISFPNIDIQPQVTKIIK